MIQNGELNVKNILNEMFSRNILYLSEELQEKIYNSSIAVIGLGGVGSTVTELLVRLGVQKLIIVARKYYELGNINRQIGATYINILSKIFKVDAVARRLIEINPFCQIYKIRGDVIKNTNKIKSILNKNNVEIIFNCVDEFKSQLAVASIAQDLGSYMIIGGVIGLGDDGIVTAFSPNGLKYSNLFNINHKLNGINLKIDLLIKSKWLNKNIKRMNKKVISKYKKDIKTPYPVLTPLPWLLSSLMVLEACKIITGIGQHIIAPDIILVKGLKPQIIVKNVKKEEASIDEFIPWRP